MSLAERCSDRRRILPDIFAASQRKTQSVRKQSTPRGEDILNIFLRRYYNAIYRRPLEDVLEEASQVHPLQSLALYLNAPPLVYLPHTDGSHQEHDNHVMNEEPENAERNFVIFPRLLQYRRIYKVKLRFLYKIQKKSQDGTVVIRSRIARQMSVRRAASA